MKKLLMAFMLALCLMPACVQAEEAFVLQETMVMSGMDKSWYQGYEPSVSGGTLTICLPVKSEKSNGKLTATLVMDDPEISPIKTEKLSAIFWRSEGLFSVKLSFKLSESRVNGDYAARVVLKGDDKDGTDLVSEYPVVIRIRDGADPNDMQPDLEMEEVSLNVGEAGSIRLTVRNAGRYAEMENLMLTVTDASGDILPAESDVMMLTDLLPGEEAQIDYAALVKPDSAVELHPVTMKLTYLAAGAERTWEETFTLPVTQEIRLEQGGVQLASSVIQGDMATLTLPLMNMGKGDLHNVMATLTLPGVTEGQSVLAGVIAPGETKQAKISFMPGKNVLGFIEGEVRVQCEDTWGNETAFTVPMSITVEEPAPVAQVAVSLAEEAQEKHPYILYILAGVCAALVLALILQGALLRRKIHRLEEDRL